MKRHAIFVDAGYVFAQGSVSLLGKNSNRSQLKLDETEFVNQLASLALRQSPGVGLLRIYWYDGAKNGPTVDHLTLAEMPNVKLRLGSINSGGEQKEVDSLLITDLIDLARNQSICDATVITGDKRREDSGTDCSDLWRSSSPDWPRAQPRVTVNPAPSGSGYGARSF